MAEEYKLTYFNYRGLAEPIRLILKYIEVPFEDIRIEWDDEWTLSQKTRFPWACLPVLDFGNLKLSQSVTICRYLANKYGLTGADEFEAAKCDELVDAMADLRLEWTVVFMELNPEKKSTLSDKFAVSMSDTFKNLVQILKKNGGKYFVGNSLTWTDIYIAYFFDFYKVGSKFNDILAEYPDLQNFQNEIFAIPQLKKWIAIRPIDEY